MKLLLVLASFILVSCNSREEKAEISPLEGHRFARIQTAILQPKCVSCHSAASKADGIDLSSYSVLMASGIVIPSKPEASDFYLSLKSGKMPKNGSKISEEELQLVFDWIRNGAGETDTETATGPTPSFQSISSTTLERKCVVCHNSAKPRGKVDLSSFEGLLQSPGNKHKPVVAGNPEASGLFLELHEGKMPPTPRLFNEEELAALYTWIKNGALEVTPGALPQPVPGAPNPPQPTYEWLSRNLLNRRCGSCHGIPYKVGNIDFTSYATLMDSPGIFKKPVVPGNPEESAIYDEPFNQRMPPPRHEVTPDEVDLIRLWILQGAKNN